MSRATKDEIRSGHDTYEATSLVSAKRTARKIAAGQSRG